MKNTNTLQNDYVNYKKSNFICTYQGLGYNSYNINLYFNKFPNSQNKLIDILELYLLDNVYSCLYFGYYINKIDLKDNHAFVSIDINTD